MPIYTYECPMGHQWDEVRTINGSETSEEPCAVCLENADRHGVELFEEEVRDLVGTKVPTRSSVSFRGHGFTPTFYPNRRENK